MQDTLQSERRSDPVRPRTAYHVGCDPDTIVKVRVIFELELELQLQDVAKNTRCSIAVTMHLLILVSLPYIQARSYDETGMLIP